MPPAGVLCDVPTLFVDKDVMPPTQQDETVEIGAPAFRPQLSVMDLEKRRSDHTQGIGNDSGREVAQSVEEKCSASREN